MANNYRVLEVGERPVQRWFAKMTTVKKTAPYLANIVAVPCPFCSAPMDEVPMEILVFHYAIKEQEARILRAIWAGRGAPVSIDRILPVVHVNEEVNPSDRARTYAAFKESLHRLRKRLNGSGFTIKSAGYGAGYYVCTGLAPVTGIAA